MKYINYLHKKLSKGQTSSLMLKINRYPFDKRVGIIAAALFTGMASMAMAWSGTSSARIYFCIQSPTGEVCADKNNRPFRMTPYHWNQWGLNGRSKYVIKKRVELPSNPAKPLQSAVGFIGFAAAAWMFRQLQHEQNRKSKWDALVDKRDEAIAELNTQIELMEVARDLELSATDNAVIIQQAELLGEVEVKLTQMETTGILFEAETAGMTEEQKTEYVDFIRRQQTPYLSGTQNLGKTIDPRDKVEGQENQSIEGDWVSHAVNHFCVLVFGGQHGGKTTAASHIVKARKDRGDRVIVLDPHAEKGQWKGLEVVGAGMDYEAIDNFMCWYFEECERRYRLLRSEGKAAVQRLGAICMVAEELTNYAKRCKNSAEFIQACLSDNRKIFFNSLFVSHGRTLSLMGGSQGTAKTRDDSFLELHCIPPTDGSSRIWSVKYPGGDFTPVTVPNWETIFDFTGSSEPTTLTPEKLEEIWDLEYNPEPDTEWLNRPIDNSSSDLNAPEPGSATSEPLNRPTDNSSSDSITRFYTPLKLSKQQILELINSLNSELTQTQLIERLWHCSKGGSAAWREAYSEFRELMDSQ